MSPSLTAGLLCAVAALLAAKAGAWSLFQRKVMKETDGLLARHAEVVLTAAVLLAGVAAWMLLARPF